MHGIRPRRHDIGIPQGIGSRFFFFRLVRFWVPLVVTGLSVRGGRVVGPGPPEEGLQPTYSW